MNERYFSNPRKQGGKLIVSRLVDPKNGKVSFVKYRTRLQVIEKNTLLGRNRKTILHYDLV